MEPNGYSRLQIALHWLVALFVLGQFILSEGIEKAWGIVEDGGHAGYGLGVWQHIAFGLLVLAFALWRISLRLRRGVPAAAEGEPAAQRLAAAGVHLGLYLLMVALPVTGLVAWYGGVEAAGGLHQLAKTALLGFIGLHVLGAFYNQFVLKNRLIARMIRADD